ncbi:septum formation protein Maf [Candidatus Peregrinibacteria bacterium CG_4_10_14_0_2_um_filter_43_11]|nr:MAG: septum formation protein Maf [Candidatus Peregrinibacteria bacterium CG_4_10_14_0_2_um_filter_43_11]
MTPSLILASGSPQRKRILEKLGIRFQAFPSRIDESHDGRTRVHAICKHIAFKKAQAVSESFATHWVLGVDTIVVLPSGTVCGKPESKKVARRMLREYSGRYCDVYSGIALVHHSSAKKMVRYEKTRLFFRSFSDEEIDAYLELDRWQGSSGAMTIEGVEGRWVKRIQGCYWNIVGLPVNSLKKMLTSRQVNQ